MNRLIPLGVDIQECSSERILDSRLMMDKRQRIRGRVRLMDSICQVRSSMECFMASTKEACIKTCCQTMGCILVECRLCCCVYTVYQVLLCGLNSILVDSPLRDYMALFDAE